MRQPVLLLGNEARGGKYMRELEHMLTASAAPTQSPTQPMIRLLSDVDDDGIENLGNSCYISASLQLLRSMRGFVCDVQALDAEELRNKPLLRALKSHFSSSGKGGRSASDVKSAMAMVREEYGDFAQQDAMEFITVMLEQIEHEMGPENTDRCPSRRNFTWNIEHRIACARCASAATIITERMYSLTLDVVQNEQASFDMLIRRYFAHETLERTCETCSHGFATSKRALRSTPRLLLAHVKRFAVSRDRRGKVQLGKIGATIRLPSVLDMSQCIANVCGDGGAGDDEEAASSLSAPMTLLAVINHLGSSLSSGHFLAHVKHETAVRQWSQYDDANVNIYTERACNMSTLKEFERECYIIAYTQE
jgi:uncharacterized UBP type Zn finger protein